MGCAQSTPSGSDLKTSLPQARPPAGFLKGIKGTSALFQRSHKSSESGPDKSLSALNEVGSVAGVDTSPCPQYSSRLGLKVLVVCEVCDDYFQELCSAIDDHCYFRRVAHNAQQAVAQFTVFLPQLVFVDFRQGCFNKNLLRALKGVKVDHQVIFIAVSKSSVNQEETTNAALKAGFDKVVMESSNIPNFLSEISEAFVQNDEFASTLALNESVYIALDKSRDLVIITDQSHVVQYVNSPCLQILGYSKEEMTGTILTTFQDYVDLPPVLRQLERGFDWLGKMRWKCKTGESLALQCRIVPAANAGMLPTYYIYLQDNPLENHIYPRGSLPSIRKGSYDLKSIVSEGSARRQSLAKLHNLPLEAPITKVLSLLCAAQENASPAVVQMLEQVMDILRTTELYTSQLKVDNLRAEDPLTTNLIAALVAQGPPSAAIPRRTSNDSITIKKKAGAKKNNYVNLPMSREMREAFDKVLQWEFDVIQVEKLSQGKPLLYVGMKVFMYFSVHKTFGIDEKTIYGWLNMIERNYKPTNTYHNSTHAADVLQVTACFLAKLRMRKLLDPLDEACCLIAAAAHDVGHPGKSSAFLTNSGDELAILYNDISVLEQHHAALTFRLTLKDERVNIFKGLDRKAYTSARACVVDMILATDMFKHFEHYTKFVTVFNKSTEDMSLPESKSDRQDRRERSESECELSVNAEDVMVVKRMLIKCADVSNPTRPLLLCKQWAKRIAEEYFAQTDEEKTRNLPVVMPLFDRNTCSIPVSQMGFMDYIVNNMFEEWDSFIEMPEMLYHLRKNYDYWKELHDKGITSIEDPNEKQSHEPGYSSSLAKFHGKTKAPNFEPASGKERKLSDNGCISSIKEGSSEEGKLEEASKPYDEYEFRY